MEFDINYNYIEIFIETPNTVVLLSNDRRGDLSNLDNTDWGDGESNSELTHTYTNSGSYIIKSKLSINDINYNDTLNNLVINYHMLNSNMTNLDYLMAGFTNIKSINFDNFADYSNITSMKGIFKLCKSLETIEIKKYNISKVKDLSYFIYGCENIKNADIFSLKDSKPYILDYAFSNTPLNFVDDINLCFLDTIYVRSATHLFENCNNLTNFKKVIENLDFTCCDNIEYCFANTGIDVVENLELVNCENITSLEGLFYNCINLKNADLKNFSTFDIENMENTFANCSLLEYVDLRGLRIDEIKNLKYTFKNNTSLKRININNLVLEIENEIEYDGLFDNCFVDRIDMYNCDADTINFMINIIPTLDHSGSISTNRIDGINEDIALNKLWNIHYIPHETEKRCILLNNIESSLLVLKEYIDANYSTSGHIHNEYVDRLNSVQQRIVSASERVNILSGGNKQS